MEAHSEGHHLVNWVSLFHTLAPDSSVSAFLVRHVNVVFALIAATLIGLAVQLGTRRKLIIPSRSQLALEGLVEGLQGFVMGILGPHGKAHVPFIGTLFIYIWVMNMMGLIPLMHAPTSSINTTIPLAVVVFFYVQILAVRSQGILGYLDHLAGSPRDAFGFVLMPLMFVIHIVGELAKPTSLCLRLAGNITGEDTLLAVFVSMGASALAFLPIPAGLPYQAPFILLSLLLGSIQAFVFTLLTTVYIAMVLPHDDHQGEPAHH